MNKIFYLKKEIKINIFVKTKEHLNKNYTNFIFSKYFLGLHEERSPITHVSQSIYNLGDINWEIVACVLIVYIICYFSLWKGIKMSGKVLFLSFCK